MLRTESNPFEGEVSSCVTHLSKRTGFNTLLSKRTGFNTLLSKRSGFNTLLSKRSGFNTLLSKRSEFNTLLSKRSGFNTLLSKRSGFNVERGPCHYSMPARGGCQLLTTNRGHTSKHKTLIDEKPQTFSQNSTGWLSDTLAVNIQTRRWDDQLALQLTHSGVRFHSAEQQQLPSNCQANTPNNCQANPQKCFQQ